MRLLLVIALLNLTGCCSPWDPRCEISKEFKSDITTPKREVKHDV